MKEKAPKQVHLRITCDEGHTADFLRQLANAIEEADYEFGEYETYHGIAEFD